MTDATPAQRKRVHPAAAARIAVAGTTLTAGLGLVAFMGASARAEEAATEPAPVEAAPAVPAAPPTIVVVIRREVPADAAPASSGSGSSGPSAAAGPSPQPAPAPAAPPPAPVSRSGGS